MSSKTCQASAISLRGLASAKRIDTAPALAGNKSSLPVCVQLLSAISALNSLVRIPLAHLLSKL